VPLTLVTGPADCGKTSWCRGLARDRPGFAGVLEPKLYEAGRRIGYDLCGLENGERLPFARLPGPTLPGSPAQWVQRAGPFLVSAQTARAAESWVRGALARAPAGPKGLILDEIGPLELRGGGLAPALALALQCCDRLEVVLVVQARCLPALAESLPAHRLVELPARGAEGANPQEPRAGPAWLERGEQDLRSQAHDRRQRRR
jgi:nucleoside-triphosphatase THEP1